MKNVLFVAAAFSALTLTSCTKVVEIDLNKSNPQYVIEGNVTNAEKFQTVHITRSVNFNDLNQYPAVTNAIVTINDDGGNLDTLIQGEPGYYHTTKIEGVPGRTYTLSILVDGRKFLSSSTMPQAVFMDTLAVADQTSFGKKIKAPVVTFHERSGKGHYYYFMVYRNNHRIKSIYIDNDLANDGGIVERSLPDPDSSYVAGDKVCVDIQSISKDVYDYYFSLQQTIGQNSATPANPVTNIIGGNVLGYFSAHTADRRELVIQ